MGTLPLTIPRVRQGTYFPSFLEPRRLTTSTRSSTGKRSSGKGRSLDFSSSQAPTTVSVRSSGCRRSPWICRH